MARFSLLGLNSQVIYLRENKNIKDIKSANTSCWPSIASPCFVQMLSIKENRYCRTHFPGTSICVTRGSTISDMSRWYLSIQMSEATDIFETQLCLYHCTSYYVMTGGVSAEIIRLAKRSSGDFGKELSARRERSP